MRDLNSTDQEIADKLNELRLFVVEKSKKVSNMSRTNMLITDLKILSYLWEDKL